MTTRSNIPYGVDQVKRSLIHFIFGKVVAAIVGLSLLLLLVRALPASEYGIYMVMLAILEITLLSSSFGLYALGYRYVPELRSRHQGLALFRFLCQLCAARISTLILATLVIYFFVKLIASWVGLNGYEDMLVLYMVVVVGEGFSRYLELLFDSLLMQGQSQIGAIFRNGLRLGALLAVYWHSGGEISLLLWIEIEMVACVIGAIYSSYKLYQWALELKFANPGNSDFHNMFSSYWAFAGPNFLSQLLYTVYGIDTAKLLASKFVGVLQTGIFGFAASLLGMLQRYLPVFLLLNMVRPLFVSARIEADGFLRMDRLSRILLKLNLFVLFPMVAYLVAFGDTLLDFLSGGKFPNAGGYIIALVILLIFQTWHVVLGLLAMTIEDGISGMYGTFLGLFGLLLGIALLPKFGVYGLCVGLIMSEIIWCAFVHFSLGRKGLHVTLDWSGVIKIGISSLVAWATIVLSGWESLNLGLIQLVIGFFLMSIVFLTSAFFLKPFDIEERNQINRILPIKLFVW